MDFTKAPFYAHIVASPIALILGLLLLNATLREHFPRLHRRIGQVQVAIVLLLVTPSGLVMAQHAAGGRVSGVGLASLAVVTAGACGLGFRDALKGRYARHELWMRRVFTLLCSAVVLRILGGIATLLQAGADWVDPLLVWASWLTPLAAFEIGSRLTNLRDPLRPRRRIETDRRSVSAEMLDLKK